MSRHFPQVSLLTLASEDSTPRIVIVASQYNARFVDAMVLQAKEELRVLHEKVNLEVIHVPGALEIPLLVKLVAERQSSQRPSAIIALGLILQGETAHAHLIAEAITHALLELSLNYSLPIIHEVLFVKNEEQAEARCIKGPLYRGKEAARAAIATLQAIHILNS